MTPATICVVIPYNIVHYYNNRILEILTKQVDNTVGSFCYVCRIKGLSIIWISLN